MFSHGPLDSLHDVITLLMNLYCSFLAAALKITIASLPTRFKTGDLPMGRPQEAPPVTHDEFKKYVKKMHLKWKRETAQPKEVAPRNFAAEQLRQDAEAMSRGRFTREVFKPGTAGEPSDGL